MQEDTKLDLGTLKLCFNFDKIGDLANSAHVSNIARMEYEAYHTEKMGTTSHNNSNQEKKHQVLEVSQEGKALKGLHTPKNHTDHFNPAKVHRSFESSVEKQNKELRAELQEVKVKIAKLSNTIELENRPAGFDIPVGWMHSRFSSVTARLHEELLVFRAEVEQKMKKIEELAQTICGKLQTLVRDIDPELDVAIYGSLATGLCMPWSDIDLIIMRKEGLQEQSKFKVSTDLLGQLEAKLKESSDIFTEVNHIPNATIPVLKAVTNSSYQSRKIDITVQDGKHTGLKCVDLVKDYLKQFEVLHTLVVAFKQLIYSCQMNDPYLGGMTSYALILVLVAFLQGRAMSPIKPTERNPLSLVSPNLGTLFLEFMQFYTSFDNMSMEVAPYPPGAKIDKSPFVERNRLLSGHRHQLQAEILQNMLNLTVRDPLNSANNVTRNARKYIQLRNIFSSCVYSAFSVSLSEYKDWQHTEQQEQSGVFAESVQCPIKPRASVFRSILATAKSITELPQLLGASSSH